MTNFQRICVKILTLLLITITAQAAEPETLRVKNQLDRVVFVTIYYLNGDKEKQFEFPLSGGKEKTFQATGRVIGWGVHDLFALKNKRIFPIELPQGLKECVFSVNPIWQANLAQSDTT